MPHFNDSNASLYLCKALLCTFERLCMQCWMWSCIYLALQLLAIQLAVSVSCISSCCLHEVFWPKYFP